MKRLLLPLVCFPLFAYAGLNKSDCVHVRWQAKFHDADGDVGPFANMKYSLIRATNGAVVYQGASVEKGQAHWENACKGEAYTIRQNGFIGE
ncbi:hypothetical protein [Burkholderia ubonensis]|uniref:hypothetical protein n=1 Tax=Burkholderia ubonensis TaxID=101571 RepID=UPI000A94155D|nr:hypothetical protein [Burkholderia ubonensis]